MLEIVLSSSRSSCEADTQTPLEELIDAMPWSTGEMHDLVVRADLSDVYTYLRRCKDLSIPPVPDRVVNFPEEQGLLKSNTPAIKMLLKHDPVI